MSDAGTADFSAHSEEQIRQVVERIKHKGLSLEPPNKGEKPDYICTLLMETAAALHRENAVNSRTVE